MRGGPDAKRARMQKAEKQQSQVTSMMQQVIKQQSKKQRRAEAEQSAAAATSSMERPSKKKQKSQAAPVATATSQAKRSKSSSSAASSAAPPSDIYQSEYINGHALAFDSDPSTATSNGIELDSRLTSRRFLEWLIYPLTIESFYKNYFEKKPIYISRRKLAIPSTVPATQSSNGHGNSSNNVASGEVILVSTKRDLDQYLPRSEEELARRLEKAAAKATNKPAVASIKEHKTVINALNTEYVTVLKVEGEDIKVAETTSQPASPFASSSSSSTAAASSSSSSPSSSSHYYSNWFSIDDIHSLLAANPPKPSSSSSLASPSAGQPNASDEDEDEESIHYRRDIDITRYRNGVRETLNPQGRASLDAVKKFIAEGCSVRFLAPHKYSRKLWRMINLLDEALHMQVGANSYYTPKRTQGFAPHYDDVDVLVIQTEGSKRWRLYAPRSSNEILPSVSSPNFSQQEIGEPIMDVVLHAGDFLYAPRGTIHQCVASEEEHSLHVTLSTCLNTNWTTYFNQMLPALLQQASEEHVDFRRSLPRHFDQYMGVMHSDPDTTPPSIQRSRERFMDSFMALLEKLVDLETGIPFDSVADSVIVQEFMAARVPPCLTDNVKQRTKDGLGSSAASAADSKKQQKSKRLIKDTTMVRLVQSGIARLTTASNGSSLNLYHILQNSRLYKSHEIGSLEVPVGYAATIEQLIRNYPRYTQVQQLPLPEPDEEEDEEEQSFDEAAQSADRLELIETLFDEGLIELTNSTEHIPQQLRKGENDAEDDEEEEELELDDEYDAEEMGVEDEGEGSSAGDMYEDEDDDGEGMDPEDAEEAEDDE